MQPLNNHIILKQLQENKSLRGLIIPQQYAANQITFAKVIDLPKEPLNTKNLKVGDYVVLGYSPVWERKYKHKIGDEEYLIVDEYAILGIVNDPELLDRINLEENN